MNSDQEETNDQKLYNQLPQQIRGMTSREIYHELRCRALTNKSEWDFATPVMIEALRLRNGILYQQYMLECYRPPKD